MSKQTTVAQIIEWKERRGESTRPGFTIIHKIHSLARDYESIKSETFHEFIPIRLSTIIEVYTRESIRDLIDGDEKNILRIDDLLKNRKLDFEIIKSLYGRKITFGDLVAHTISINGISDIISSFDNIIPNFKHKMETITERWTEERGSLKSKILTDPRSVFSNIEKMFKTRHVLSHEMPLECPFNKDDLDNFILSSYEFLSAIDWVIVSETHGYVPLTQSNMNSAARDELAVAENEMEEILTEIECAGQFDIEALKNCQRLWGDYAAAEAELLSSEVAGGTMYSMIYASHKMELTKARNAQLRQLRDRKEGDC